MEYVGFIYTKWEKINTDFLPFGSSIYGNICFDNVLLCKYIVANNIEVYSKMSKANIETVNITEQQHDDFYSLVAKTEEDALKK